MKRSNISSILGRWENNHGAYEDIMRIINEKNPHLIAIDGKNGSGKTTLSGWLSWQLGCPVIHIDLHFIGPNEHNFNKWNWRDHADWRHNEIENMLSARLNHEHPHQIIIEGVLVQDRLDYLGRVPDLLIWVEKMGDDDDDDDLIDEVSGLKNEIKEEIESGLRCGLINPYIKRRNPRENAFIFRVKQD